VFYAL
jgi:hypothetical protein